MYCRKCGAPVPDDANFCPGCGTPASRTDGPAADAGNGGGAPPVTPRRKMATWKKVLLGIVVVIAAAVALALLLTGPLVEPVENQLAALRSGDVDGAYAMTSEAFRRAVSRERFAAFLKANPVLMHAADYSFSERKRSNGVGTLKGTLETEDGGRVPVVYKLVEENGAWKILSITLPKQGVSSQ